MEAYRLYTVVPKLVAFLESLTNWYVRLNRDRMRGTDSITDAEVSLNTTYDVLLDATILLAPVVPFLTDNIYQNLKRALPANDKRLAESVHFVMLSDHDPAALKPDIVLAVENMQRVIQLGRKLREKKNVLQKKPVASVKIMHADAKFHDGIKMLQSYVKEELNVEDVFFTTDMSAISVSAVPNFRKLGKRVGKMMKEVKEACEKLTSEQIREYESKGTITCAASRCPVMSLRSNAAVDRATWKATMTSSSSWTSPRALSWRRSGWAASL
jgi:isoleucyl-tRNA synthetase